MLKHIVLYNDFLSLQLKFPEPEKIHKVLLLSTLDLRSLREHGLSGI